MSITLRLINIIDSLKIQKYFLEDKESVKFLPIQIRINENIIEQRINAVFKLKGKPYRPNSLERKVLDELDF